ncbi:MAG: hypothetical protein IT306_30115 [Chloroflexi bacterium]|nr:hypothetical protein [Chloroflexota bacterium]
MRRWRRGLLIAMAADIALLACLWIAPRFFMSGGGVSLTSAYTMLAYLMIGSASLLLLALVLGIAVAALTIRIKLTEY